VKFSRQESNIHQPPKINLRQTLSKPSKPTKDYFSVSLFFIFYLIYHEPEAMTLTTTHALVFTKKERKKERNKERKRKGIFPQSVAEKM
jgi:hypothetical protein